MSERARKAHRMLALQQQMHRVEAWKLAELQRTLAQLDASQTELIGALNDDQALHGLFIDKMAKRLSALSDQSAQIALERDAQSRSFIEQAGRLKVVERLCASADLQDARSDTHKELLEAIEHFLNRSGARLP